MSSAIHFDKYTFSKNQPIPDDMQLRGAIGITRDTKHANNLHRFFFVMQKVYHKVHRMKDHDANLCHGMVLLDFKAKDITAGLSPVTEEPTRKKGRAPKKPTVKRVIDPNKKMQYLAHGVFRGIVRSHRDYLEDKDCTELVVYIPKNEKLRERIAKFAEQSSVEARDERANAAKRKKDKKAPRIAINPFSIPDMLKSFFHFGTKPTERKMRRTALAVTDLLQGHMPMDRKGHNRGYFCMPYAMTILQSAMIAETLEESEIEEIGKMERKAAAEFIYKKIKDHADDPFWTFDSRFGMSGRSGKLMDQYSTIHQPAARAKQA